MKPTNIICRRSASAIGKAIGKFAANTAGQVAGGLAVDAVTGNDKYVAMACLSDPYTKLHAHPA